jgi:acyl-coenzyme A thioesterase PaaI-like protein
MDPNFARKLSKRFSLARIFPLINYWRPFRGAGIKVIHFTKDFREIEVEMKLRWYNKNFVGTQFGGSLYAMTDPFYMIMIMQNIGDGYIVWDKAAKIEFKKPGRSRVTAKFKLTESQIIDIKTNADNNPKYVFDLLVSVISDEGETIAVVTKTIYVKKK